MSMMKRLSSSGQLPAQSGLFIPSSSVWALSREAASGEVSQGGRGLAHVECCWRATRSSGVASWLPAIPSLSSLDDRITALRAMPALPPKHALMATAPFRYPHRPGIAGGQCRHSDVVKTISRRQQGPARRKTGICRMSESGHDLPFATPMERVWNAVESRPSTPRSRERRQSAG